MTEMVHDEKPSVPLRQFYECKAITRSTLFCSNPAKSRDVQYFLDSSHRNRRRFLTIFSDTKLLKAG